MKTTKKILMLLLSVMIALSSTSLSALAVEDVSPVSRILSEEKPLIAPKAMIYNGVFQDTIWGTNYYDGNEAYAHFTAYISFTGDAQNGNVLSVNGVSMSLNGLAIGYSSHQLLGYTWYKDGYKAVVTINFRLTTVHIINGMTYYRTQDHSQSVSFLA